jgi:hypothetical protein
VYVDVGMDKSQSYIIYSSVKLRRLHPSVLLANSIVPIKYNRRNV